MSILMNLWGITPEEYERRLAGPSGFQPGLAAIAIGGGWPIDDPVVADYGGAYVLSPHQVSVISPALALPTG